jgi:methylenetetrahydrofolate dehydrogenase (NADP+) / methenyltetrahydrofolate cyclohydrolase
MKLIDGKKLAEKINLQTKQLIETKAEKRPGLAIILVGSQEDSKLYVKLKEKEAFKIGIETHTYLFDEEASKEEILEVVEYLNNDPEIDAILVQLPLPKKFDACEIIFKIDPRKDVDRFHPDNVSILQKTCSHSHVIPPVLAVVLEILKSINCELEDKNICIIANSDLFGKSLAKVLECKKAQVCVLRSGDKNIIQKASKADILISAIGKPKFVGEEMVKEGAVVIDIGISKKGKSVLGDVDLEKVKNKVSYITPVPGGVGPMTVAMLLRNTFELAQKKAKSPVQASEKK